ncbi:hypothetical protein Pint_13525 [Pistacia integerrima]|uniref:Uncharacterized protein n=1 Tax=Pistacia integerrima TaxID=434235 RepID=A0ACC0Y4G4_9ROSI|nr:hypothetical protein Pint_13525 [Pistacia integerrima]
MTFIPNSKRRPVSRRLRCWRLSCSDNARIRIEIDFSSSSYRIQLQMDNTLQSICYKRGSLQLLDQRKLPLETDYLNIRDVADGWSAIRDMVVRGAPAIAIAAALSLAVEVFHFDAFTGTSADAASFLENKLDYLVSSRPTAVNLADAATKLKQIISRAAAIASDANSVFQAYIEAAEIMLKDDVASNKAIGSHGASFLQHQLKNSNKLSVLTHCNTGSLATAGYGTALGVIRALHAEGVLERAYCTETRPFNQVSIQLNCCSKSSSMLQQAQDIHTISRNIMKQSFTLPFLNK